MSHDMARERHENREDGGGNIFTRRDSEQGRRVFEPLFKSDTKNTLRIRPAIGPHPGYASEALQTSELQAFIDTIRVLRVRKSAIEEYGSIVFGIYPNRGAKDKCAIVPMSQHHRL
jgi:hypothetical protein